MLRNTVAAVLCMIAFPAWSANITLTDGNDRYKLTTPGKVYGRKGNDRLIVWNADAILAGQEGDDILIGHNVRRGFSTLKGGPGNDRIYCDGLCDAYGGPGDDYIETTTFAANLWGGLGSDTFSIFVPPLSPYYTAWIGDFAADDKLKLYLPDASNGYQSRSFADIFDVLDINRDGVFDETDGTGAWNEWHASAFAGDLSDDSQPGVILYANNQEINYFIYIFGIDHITRSQLVR